MAKVTNNAGYPVVLSDGTQLAAGEEVDVKDWAKLKDHHVIAAMVDAGQLSVGTARAESGKPDSDKK